MNLVYQRTTGPNTQPARQAEYTWPVALSKSCDGHMMSMRCGELYCHQISEHQSNAVYTLQCTQETNCVYSVLHIVQFDWCSTSPVQWQEIGLRTTNVPRILGHSGMRIVRHLVLNLVGRLHRYVTNAVLCKR